MARVGNVRERLASSGFPQGYGLGGHRPAACRKGLRPRACEAQSLVPKGSLWTKDILHRGRWDRSFVIEFGLCPARVIHKNLDFKARDIEGFETMAVLQAQFTLSGWEGGPGVNTWHWQTDELVLEETATSLVQSVMNFYVGADPYFADGVRISAPSLLKVLNEATGNVNQLVQITAPDDHLMDTLGDAAGRASMIKIQLITDTLINNRRVRGGIYLGPIAEASIEHDGSVSSEARSVLNLLLGNVRDESDFVGSPLCVWHRPRSGAGGQGCVVRGHDVWQKVAILRGRRD